MSNTLFFRASTSNHVNFSSENVSGLDSDDMILDDSRNRMNKIKEYESNKRGNSVESRSIPLNENKMTNSSHINYDYHPILSFFNDY